MSQRFFWRLVAGYVVGILVFFFVIPFFLFALGSNLTIGMFFPPTYRMIIFLILSIWGLYLASWANAVLLFDGKGGPAEFWGHAISPQTTTLVKTGPYAIIRHPMSTGMFLFYAGLCFLFNSLLAFVLLCGLVLIVKVYLEKVEEKRLTQQFGNEYLEYSDKIPMLWAWIKKV